MENIEKRYDEKNAFNLEVIEEEIVDTTAYAKGVTSTGCCKTDIDK